MCELIISERTADNFVVLDLNGDITFGEGTINLRQTIRRLISEKKKRIVLNLADVHYVDSSGIGEFISSLTATNREEGGQLILLNPTERINQLLKISKLLTIFDIRYDENSAVVD